MRRFSSTFGEGLRAEDEKLKGLASTGSKKPKSPGATAAKKSPKAKKRGLQLPLAEVTTEIEETEE